MRKTLQILIESLYDSSGVDDAQGGMDDLGKSTENLAGLAKGAVVAGYAAAALAVANFALDSIAAYGEVESSIDKMQRQLGVTEQVAHELGDTAQEVFAEGFFEDVGESTKAVGFLRQQVKSLNDDELGATTERVAAVADTFEKDFNEVASATQTLSDSFGIEFNDALDIVTKGLQTGLDRSGDLLDTVSEYSTQFANAQATPKEFFSILESGLAGGVLGTDKAADAFKEFTLKITTGSDGIKSQLAIIGISYDELKRQIDSGSITQTEAFNTVVNALSNVDEKIADSVTKSGELGSQFEDLGSSAVRELSTVSSSFDDVAGSADGVANNYDDLQVKTEKLGRVWNTVKTNVGSALEPLASGTIDVALSVLTRLADLSTHVADVLDDQSESTEELTEASDDFNQQLIDLGLTTTQTVVLADKIDEKFKNAGSSSEIAAAKTEFYENALAAVTNELGITEGEMFQLVETIILTDEQIIQLAESHKIAQQTTAELSDKSAQLAAQKTAVTAASQEELIVTAQLQSQRVSENDILSQLNETIAENAEIVTDVVSALHDESISRETATQLLTDELGSRSLAEAAIRQETEARGEQQTALERSIELQATETERLADYLTAVSTAPQAVSDYGEALTLAADDGNQLIETEYGLITANELVSESLIALQDELRNTALEKALTKAETLEEIEAALQLGVQLGTLTAAQAAQRLEYASDLEAIDTVTTALQGQTITVDEAADAIDILTKTQGLGADAALRVADANIVTTEKTGAFKQGATELTGVLNTLVNKDYFVDVTTNADDAAAQADNVTRAVNNIPSKKEVQIVVTQSGGATTDTGDVAFMSGGFTGFGTVSEIAGFVHKQELVIPANVRESGLGGVLDFIAMNDPLYSSGDMTATPAPVFSGNNSLSNNTAATINNAGSTYNFIVASAGDANLVAAQIERIERQRSYDFMGVSS